MQPKAKYVPGFESFKNATSSSASPRAVINRVTTRPCASGTAIGKLLNNSQSAALPIPHRCAEESQKRLLETRVSVPHRKGPYRLSQTRQSHQPVQQGIRVSRGSAQRVARHQIPVPTHTMWLRHRGTPATDQSTGKTSNRKSQRDISSKVMHVPCQRLSTRPTTVQKGCYSKPAPISWSQKESSVFVVLVGIMLLHFVTSCVSVTYPNVRTVFHTTSAKPHSVIDAGAAIQRIFS